MPDSTMPPAFSWESQARQYPIHGNSGLHWEKHSVALPGGDAEIDCLLTRDAAGHLIGILNYYLDSNSGLEERGNFNIWVRPDRQRMGLATAMLLEADRKYAIDLDQQRFTSEGAMWIQGLADKGIISITEAP